MSKKIQSHEISETNIIDNYICTANSGIIL
jgi:hypothetical protein